ncbi:MAG TPA: nuclear transport factor 2 family protein [Burkholderiales bacterium]|nr:nuclear transport factor 2 family protein [Burkholderiales bacterium]HXV09544.1 nuclear transport factor 2 family protein [Burkholderiales bacterium]
MKTMKRAMNLMLIIAFAMTGTTIAAQMKPLGANDPRAADRKELRDLLEKTEQAFNKVDVEAVIGVLAKDAVVVWQDGRRTTNHDEVRDHYKRTFQGAGAILKSLDIQATLGAPALFYGGNNAVAYGTTRENYQLIAGTKVSLDGLWTAHVIKQNGKWSVASLHFSINPFDNEVLRKAEQAAWLFGGGGIALGLLAGWLLGRRRNA